MYFDKQIAHLNKNGLTHLALIRYNFELIGSLAQLVEQRTFNPLVPRSNRGRPTIFLVKSNFTNLLRFECFKNFFFKRSANTLSHTLLRVVSSAGRAADF